MIYSFKKAYLSLLLLTTACNLFGMNPRKTCYDNRYNATTLFGDSEPLATTRKYYKALAKIKEFNEQSIVEIKENPFLKGNNLSGLLKRDVSAYYSLNLVQLSLQEKLRNLKAIKHAHYPTKPFKSSKQLLPQLELEAEQIIAAYTVLSKNPHHYQEHLNGAQILYKKLTLRIEILKAAIEYNIKKPISINLITDPENGTEASTGKTPLGEHNIEASIHPDYPVDLYKFFMLHELGHIYYNDNETKFLKECLPQLLANLLDMGRLNFLDFHVPGHIRS